ncbi:MAG: hypothetical protein A2W25_15505 [candidate division Zixibacteria bacterium RBG_16_53_22]|nr:MAG: hypothetical protein A2W25_15505 [candidate division Zixibacteria bacterium RBG_16_53_22]
MADPQDLTLDDAKALLQDLEKKLGEKNKEIAGLTKQLDEHAPEAIYSISIGADGRPQATIRARPGEPLERFWFRFDTFREQCAARGIGVKAPEPPKPQAAPVTSALPPTKTEGAPAATVQSTEPPETFKAQSLVATMNEGKTYWKIKGGRYGKFGVTIWGETLAEAGFDVAQLDASKVYDVSAFTAHVWKNEEGKPTKIFKLTK